MNMKSYLFALLIAFSSFGIGSAQDSVADVEIGTYFAIQSCSKDTSLPICDIEFNEAKTIRQVIYTCEISEHFQRSGLLTQDGKFCHSDADCKLSAAEERLRRENGELIDYDFDKPTASCARVPELENAFGLCCYARPRIAEIKKNSMCTKNSDCGGKEYVCSMVWADRIGYCHELRTWDRNENETLKVPKSSPKFADMLQKVLGITIPVEGYRGKKECNTNNDCGIDEHCNFVGIVGTEDIDVHNCFKVQHLKSIGFVRDSFRGLAMCQKMEDCGSNQYCAFFPNYGENGMCVQLFYCQKGQSALVNGKNNECFSDEHCVRTIGETRGRKTRCEQIELPNNMVVIARNELTNLTLLKNSLGICCHDFRDILCDIGNALEPTKRCFTDDDCNTGFDGGELYKCNLKTYICCREVMDSRFERCSDGQTIKLTFKADKNESCPKVRNHTRMVYDVTASTNIPCRQNKGLFYHNESAFCDPQTNRVTVVGFDDLKALVRSGPEYCKSNRDCSPDGSLLCVGIFGNMTCVQNANYESHVGQHLPFFITSLVLLVISVFFLVFSYIMMNRD